MTTTSRHFIYSFFQTVETYFQNIAEDAENFREQLPFHTLQTALTALTALSILSQKNIKIGTRLFATYFYLLRNSHVPDDHNGTIEVLTDFKSQYTNG